MTRPKPPRSVWVLLGDGPPRITVMPKEWCMLGLRACRYDLHRPAKRKSKKARKR